MVISVFQRKRVAEHAEARAAHARAATCRVADGQIKAVTKKADESACGASE